MTVSTHQFGGTYMEPQRCLDRLGLDLVARTQASLWSIRQSTEVGLRFRRRHI